VLGRCLAGNHHSHIDGGYAVKRDPMKESRWTKIAQITPSLSLQRISDLEQFGGYPFLDTFFLRCDWTRPNQNKTRLAEGDWEQPNGDKKDFV